MTLLRGTYAGYLWPVLAIAVMLLLLTLTLLRLTAVQQDMRSDDQANMTWVLSQTHIKSLHLLQAAQRHDGSPASQQAMRQHFQLLLSRLHLLSDGPQRRFLASIGAEAALQEHTDTLRALYQAAGAQADAPLGPLDDIVNQLYAFHDLLSQLSRSAMIQQWEDAGQQLDSYRNTVLTAIGLLVGILLCSVFISAKLLTTLKRAQESHAIKLHSTELEARLASERRANELYRHFAALMSHQFRTPLAIMDASLQRLLRASGPLSRDELSQRVGRARDAITRLTTVLDTLLDNDAPPSHGAALHSPHALAHIAAQAIAVQHAASPHAMLRLQTPPGDDVDALCDPGLTEQILLNLLSNAVLYGPAHSPVTLRVYRQDGLACCRVEDAGGALAPDELSRLFDRGFRGRHAADTAGTGQGLSVARQLAQLQGGQLRVETTPGACTAFILSLPAAPRAATVVSEECRHDA